MNLLRCAGVLWLCLASFSVLTPASAAPQAALESAASASSKPAPKAGKPPVRATAKPAAKPAPRNQAANSKAASSKAASKSKKRKSSDAIAAPVPKAKLDLSLPPDLVKDLQPPGQAEAQSRKTLLPAMFGEKPPTQSPFQLNGRLLSNEMQLQLRNEARQQEIEGAAIEFEFKQ